MTKSFTRLALSLLTFGMVAFLPGDIYGADGEMDVMGSYFRVVWGLLVVLGVILILYGILKKRFSLFNTPASQSIKVIEMKPLMSKKALCLVEVKGEEYLLGISGDRITHIATIGAEKKSSFAATLSRTDPHNL
ncbi:MAG: FliO/MopB family protein [Desulfobulbaceae bacterium]|nr:FliO/MopB family protein [Desulfobulbaceae bacterium]